VLLLQAWYQEPLPQVMMRTLLLQPMAVVPSVVALMTMTMIAFPVTSVMTSV
jgi:hypothetical protein